MVIKNCIWYDKWVFQPVTLRFSDDITLHFGAALVEQWPLCHSYV